jgi:hypothetical protein
MLHIIVQNGLLGMAIEVATDEGNF